MLVINDPIHGPIEMSAQEMPLVDSAAFLRLRFIKQLGFADFAFPGATHSRYAHSLGAMQVATRMVDRVLASLPLALSLPHRTVLRQLVRLAVLFHDIGHAPLSHASERVMPKVADLCLPQSLVGPDEGQRQATHEDYTHKLLLDSELHDLIVNHMGSLGVTPLALAALICGRHLGASTVSVYVEQGIDLLPLLSQIVSGELDADRMDYLRRDAYACGVSYGHFDHNWLCNNLCSVEHQGSLVLALQHKAVWAFENFLLSRYHMFLAVYYHHTPLCFDYFLQQAYRENQFVLPGSAEAFLQIDDVYLWHMLRQAQDRWSKDIVARRPWRLLLQTHAYGKDPEQSNLEERLAQSGVIYFRTDSSGLLSKYFNRRPDSAALRVLEPERGRVTRMDVYTPLYRRFEEGAWVTRVFCRPDHYARAQACLT